MTTPGTGALLPVFIDSNASVVDTVRFIYSGGLKGGMQKQVEKKHIPRKEQQGEVNERISVGSAALKPKVFDANLISKLYVEPNIKEQKVPPTRTAFADGKSATKKASPNQPGKIYREAMVPKISLIGGPQLDVNNNSDLINSTKQTSPRPPSKSSLNTTKLSPRKNVVNQNKNMFQAPPFSLDRVFVSLNGSTTQTSNYESHLDDKPFTGYRLAINSMSEAIQRGTTSNVSPASQTLLSRRNDINIINQFGNDFSNKSALNMDLLLNDDFMDDPFALADPGKPSSYLKYAETLTEFEISEMNNFEKVYFTGLPLQQKIVRSSEESNNNGFDNADASYKAIIGLIINYLKL